jgi:glucokinase
MRQSAASQTIRSVNRVSVLELIQRDGPISRADIGRQLGLSLPTVMRIVEELQADELVRYSGRSASSGGRPPSLLEFNGDAYAVIGIDLGGTKTFGALSDLSGTVIHERILPTTNRRRRDPLKTLFELIESLLGHPRPAGQKLRGIGVGAPGLMQVPEGIVLNAPSLGWRDVPLQQILSERYSLPVFVENDVNLAALGEWGFGAGRGVENLVCISIGTGLGAGIILNSALYRGHNQAAGEIGYLLPDRPSLGRRYDAFGALESQAAAPGIVERARQVLQSDGAGSANGGLTAPEIFEAARQGRPWAEQVVAETVDYLALAIANISALLDPELIVLGGGVALSADLLIDPICRRLEGVIPFVPRITASSLGPRAAAMGAVIAIWNATTDYVVIERRP